MVNVRTLVRPWRRRAVDGQSPESGFTLAETLTVMMILGIITALTFGAIIATQKTVRGSIARLDQTQQAKIGVESMTKNLRTAVLPSQILGSCASCEDAAFLAGDWNKVQFYANINNPSNTVGPSKVTYALDASGTLKETIQPPDAHAADDYDYTYCTTIGVGTCKAYTRVVARNVQATAAKPLFTYFDYSGAKLALPISGATLADVNSMDLRLTVKSSPEVKGGTVITHVTMPNADALAQATDSATPTP